MRSWVVLNGVDDRTRYATFFRGASGYEPELTCGGSTDGNPKVPGGCCTEPIFSYSIFDLEKEYSCGKKIWRSAQNQPQPRHQETLLALAHTAKTRGYYLVY